MLQNPYGDLAEHKVSCRVDPQDYAYFQSHFPMLVGKTDKILSTLYKKFIDELRRRNPEPAYFIGLDNGFEVLDEIVASFGIVERCTTGSVDSGGNAGAQHDQRGTDGVCETVR